MSVDTAATVITVTATLRSDLHLGVLPTKNTVNATLGYVPGSVVRGAYARAWLVDRVGDLRTGVPSTGPLRDEFLWLFEGGVRFAPLFAAGGPRRLSELRHKYRPSAGCLTGWDQAVAGPDHQRRQGLRCLDCGQVLVVSKGEVTPPPVTRRGHTRREDDGTAADGNLYSRESIQTSTGSTATAFSGHLVADAEAHRLLDDLRPVIGGRRTSHGLVEISTSTSDSSPPPLVGGRFVVTLNAAGIFVDAAGFPARRPAPEPVAELLGVPAAAVSIPQAWTRWSDEGGWHAASGLPKHNELAVSPGSTLVIEAAGADEAGVRRVWEAGLGLRRHEGFGDLR